MSECIEFVGPVQKRDGYGYVNKYSHLYNWMPEVPVRPNAGMSAHRWAWMVANKSPNTEGRMVLHRCNNRLCINPEHLYLGDHKQNMKDRAESGNNRSGRDVLTREKVQELKELRRRGVKPTKLAKLMGVSYNCVNDVLRGKTWRDVG